MQFRLNFDDIISASLIEKIQRRGGSGSLNKTLQTMIIEWSAIEDAGNTLETRQETGIIQQDQHNLEDDLDAALDDLEAAWE